MTHFGNPALPGPIAASLRLAWAHLASPGAAWTGAERVGIAATARAARAGEPAAADLPEDAVEAAALLGVRPGAARRGWVEAISGRLGRARYVELVGVVSRLAAVDTFTHALGLDREPLPGPGPGAPTGVIDGRARANAAWVPMVGGTSITRALSLVPSESAEQERFHGPMYMAYHEMDDPDFSRGLHRPQMELVAARTSAINECFY
ncbi:MAG TPA: hypothetical protein VLL51_06250 [Gemmatimonadales bacterium]|nr:hypothetical protein [Gemmatimonadales bacterium]